MNYWMWLLAGLLLVVGRLSAAQDELERLFYTPEQRAQIEQARQAYLKAMPKRSTAQQQTQRPDKRPRVSAVIVSPDGQRQVRINGHYQPAPNARVQLRGQGKVTKSNAVE